LTPPLIDTDVMIDFLRGYPDAIDLIRKSLDHVVLSSIVVAELYAGVRGHDEQTKLNNLIALFRVVPVSDQIARMAGLYKRDYGTSHGVGLADAILAGTATVENATLKTLNVNHYPMIEDLNTAYRKG
jgi:predicted nucleic acid-binding protein